jgi:ribosome maturation factor RimP
MSQTDPLRQRLVAIVEPVCQSSGYDLVDLRLKSDQGGWVLRVYIDVATEAGEEDPEWWKHGVDLSDCETLSRELSAVLDVDDPIPQAYSLEVSSPGIDRPLRTPGHFQRFVGAEIKVSLAIPQGDRKNFKGLLTGVDDAGGDAHAVMSVDGQTYRLRIADIDTAKLVPDWDEVMKGGSGLGRIQSPKPDDTQPRDKTPASGHKEHR